MSDFDISKYMDIDDGDDGENIVLIPVVTPSGATVEVMSQDEADFYNDRRSLYRDWETSFRMFLMFWSWIVF